MIEAASEVVFAVLADPSAHAAIDGPGGVREALHGDRITAVGQVCRMAMDHENPRTRTTRSLIGSRSSTSRGPSHGNQGRSHPRPGNSASAAGSGARTSRRAARRGRPAALTQTGRAAGHRGTRLSRALSDATMAGGAPEAVGHYAITVVCAAYRRGFHAAATSLTEAAIAGRIRRLLALADNHGNMSSWSLPCSRDVASKVSAPSSALRRRSCDLHVRHLYLPTPLHAAKPPLPEWVV